MEKHVHIYPIEKNTHNREDKGNNWTNIVSELIRITAHYCDFFLSDVFYDIRAFIEAIESEEKYNKILVFREDGVTTISSDVFEGFLKEHEISGARAYFRLEYDPETGSQKLTKLNCFVTCSY